MRKALFAGLRMAIPIALGVWLVVYFYRQLDEQQRSELFQAFQEANWWWLLLSLVLSLGSHISRAWRWRYLLSPLGYQVSAWNSFNAVMSGYFMNLLVQRAGEVTRAVMLDRAEGVPFERGFGTILGERTVDMIILLGIAGVTILLQLDKLDLFQERIAAFKAGQGPVEASTSAWSGWILGLVALVVLLALAIGLYVLLTRPALQARIKSKLRGFYEGLATVFRTPHKAAFLFHTALIWLLYIAMFWVGFWALPGTQEVPFAGVMAGFIAGSVGIVLVQGGIGIYPAFVALIVSVYLPSPEGGGLLRPDALAMGWLIWVAQTVMTIIVGGLSLFLISRTRKIPLV